MNENDLPKKIPVFPLTHAIFFPKTILPLNIFEQRYIELVDDCMKNQKFFGMIQPKTKKNSESKVKIYDVGCLGKIVSFNETADKRFIISLSGIIRFKVKKEIDTSKLYRMFEVDYSSFLNDLNKNETYKKNYDKRNLINKVKLLFRKKNYLVELSEIEKLNFDQLISTICMVSPLSVEEKQKMIETVKIEDKIKTLEEILNFNLIDNIDNKTIQ
jgi:hypothetical protein